jgi:hypothetical protein
MARYRNGALEDANVVCCHLRNSELKRATPAMKQRIQRLLLALIVLATTACTATRTPAPAPATPTAAAMPTDVPPTQDLRIENVGDADIHDLTVLFPGATGYQVVRVAFGNIAAGRTSDYQPVPGGVYRYAAYEYTLAGDSASQSVVDWMGEKPLEGAQFTYRVALDITQVRGAQITLVEVRTHTSP